MPQNTTFWGYMPDYHVRIHSEEEELNSSLIAWINLSAGFCIYNSEVGKQGRKHFHVALLDVEHGEKNVKQVVKDVGYTGNRQFSVSVLRETRERLLSYVLKTDAPFFSSYKVLGHSKSQYIDLLESAKELCSQVSEEKKLPMFQKLRNYSLQHPDKEFYENVLQYHFDRKLPIVVSKLRMYADTDLVYSMMESGNVRCAVNWYSQIMTGGVKR